MFLVSLVKSIAVQLLVNFIERTIRDFKCPKLKPILVSNDDFSEEFKTTLRREDAFYRKIMKL